MDKQELKKYLKEHLRMDVDMSHDASSVKITLYLDDVKICTGEGSKYPKGQWVGSF